MFIVEREELKGEVVEGKGEGLEVGRVHEVVDVGRRRVVPTGMVVREARDEGGVVVVGQISGVPACLPREGRGQQRGGVKYPVSEPFGRPPHRLSSHRTGIGPEGRERES